MRWAVGPDEANSLNDPADHDAPLSPSRPLGGGVSKADWHTLPAWACVRELVSDSNGSWANCPSTQPSSGGGG